MPQSRKKNASKAAKKKRENRNNPYNRLKALWTQLHKKLSLATDTRFCPSVPSDLDTFFIRAVGIDSYCFLRNKIAVSTVLRISKLRWLKDPASGIDLVSNFFVLMSDDDGHYGFGYFLWLDIPKLLVIVCTMNARETINVHLMHPFRTLFTPEAVAAGMADPDFLADPEIPKAETRELDAVTEKVMRPYIEKFFEWGYVKPLAQDLFVRGREWSMPISKSMKLDEQKDEDDE